MFGGLFGNSKLKDADVKKLTEMGFSKDKVLEAMKQADYDPIFAADLLLNPSPAKNNSNKGK